eukprot:8272482-Pyramimonas_sp.AAC.1
MFSNADTAAPIIIAALSARVQDSGVAKLVSPLVLPPPRVAVATAIVRIGLASEDERHFLRQANVNTSADPRDNISLLHPWAPGFASTEPLPGIAPVPSAVLIHC